MQKAHALLPCSNKHQKCLFIWLLNTDLTVAQNILDKLTVTVRIGVPTGTFSKNPPSYVIGENLGLLSRLSSTLTITLAVPCLDGPVWSLEMSFMNTTNS